MPTTQKSPQKHTKATQKVGGSAKKPVTKAMEGGSAKKPVTKAMEGGKAASSKGKTTRGGSANGGGFKIYQETKERSENNQKLIRLLYTLINNIVNKFNRDLKTDYKFKLIKNGTQSEYIDDLNPLIEKLNDKEYIRLIKQIDTVKKLPPVYAKKSPDVYLNSNYKLTVEDVAQAEFVKADINRLYQDPEYRKQILYDDLLPSDLK